MSVSFASTSASICATTTCIGQETPYRSSIATTLFTFDGNPYDQTGYVLAVMMNSATISYTQSYLTQGLYLNLAPPQYLQALNINLSQKSFTIQLWLFIPAFTTSNDFGVFGQCDAYNVCLSISLRNARVAVSLDSMNVNNNTLIGATVISTYAFTHITVVYDGALFQLRIYMNGIIDAVSSGMIQAYQGNSSNVVTTIGRSSSYAYPNSYFTK